MSKSYQHLSRDERAAIAIGLEQGAAGKVGRPMSVLPGIQTLEGVPAPERHADRVV
jgi:hypothetical protein